MTLYSGDDFYGDEITSPTIRPAARVISATRRRALAALDRQIVNGFGVDLPGGRIVFHPTPRLWVLAVRGGGADRYFSRIDDVLDAVFGGAK
jgi:hypothetical protein